MRSAFDFAFANRYSAGGTSSKGRVCMQLQNGKKMSKEALEAALAHPDAGGMVRGKCPECGQLVQGRQVLDMQGRLKTYVTSDHNAKGTATTPCQGGGKPLGHPVTRG